MRTAGIDLSTDPKRTAVCVLDWTGGRVEFLHRKLSDHDLVDVIGSVERTAIDVPLGWPDAFVTSIGSHHNDQTWPPLTASEVLDTSILRLRATDRYLKARGSGPLSVSSDRIGATAMRGARIQALLAGAGLQVDRSGQAGVLLETYPAAVLREWDLRATGYKRSENRAARVELVSALLSRLGRLGSSAAASLEGCDDDALDAFICALVAGAAQLGCTAGPDDEHLAVTTREGWIHVPQVSPEELSDHWA